MIINKCDIGTQVLGVQRSTSDARRHSEAEDETPQVSPYTAAGGLYKCMKTKSGHF